MITYTRKHSGTCSRNSTVCLNDDGTIQSVEIVGGCDGNLKGIAKLVVGMDAKEAIKRMEGVTCGKKATSCPDQIAQTLREALEQPAE